MLGLIVKHQITFQSRMVFHGEAGFVRLFFCYLLVILLTSLALASLFNYLQTMYTFMPLSIMSMTLFYFKEDLMHFMHGQTFGNCL